MREVHLCGLIHWILFKLVSEEAVAGTTVSRDWMGGGGGGVCATRSAATNGVISH